VHLRLVSVGRDFGQSIEVLKGISVGDQLILNPADSLAEGDVVSAQPATATPAKAKT
jgi:multidrug efflux system membrane fusion protein